MITQQQLKELLHYDPLTGEFTWLSHNGRAFIGNIAGHIDKSTGYICVGIDKKVYKAHRLAWLYVYGNWPSKHMDHINRDRSDNRITNLRECTDAQNGQNKKKQANNISGYRGVHLHKPSGKWKAQIGVDGKRIYLGTYDDPAIAYQAYLDAKAKYHTFNPTV